MNYVLLSPTGVPTLGDTRTETILSASAVSVDPKLRCVRINGEADTVTFGQDFQGKAFRRECADRALVLLKRRGYSLFVNVDRA